MTEKQSGVIPLLSEDNRKKIVLVTTRNSKKWTIPKGGIDGGDSPEETARREAFEEAGIEGRLILPCAGRYKYKKWNREYEVTLYTFNISKILDNWPESHFRKRQIFSLEKGIKRIRDYSLKKLLKALLGKNGKK